MTVNCDVSVGCCCATVNMAAGSQRQEEHEMSCRKRPSSFITDDGRSDLLKCRPATPGQTLLANCPAPLDSALSSSDKARYEARFAVTRLVKCLPIPAPPASRRLFRVLSLATSRSFAVQRVVRPNSNGRFWPNKRSLSNAATLTSAQSGRKRKGDKQVNQSDRWRHSPRSSCVKISDE
jgi:hypothetical protein